MFIKTATAVVCLAGASVVAADTVDVAFVGTGAGRSVKFDLNGERQNVFAGQLLHTFSNGSGRGAELQGNIYTFCVDLLEHTSRTSSEFQVVDVEQAPGAPMGAAKANAIRDLYAFSDGRHISGGSDFAAAFQLAIWEIVSDFDTNLGRSSLDIEGGAFEAYKTNGSSLSSGVLSALGDLFNAIGVVAARQDGMNVYAVVNDGKQDQLVEMTAVPLPSAAGLGAAGILGLAGFRRRR